MTRKNAISPSIKRGNSSALSLPQVLRGGLPVALRGTRVGRCTHHVAKRERRGTRRWWNRGSAPRHPDDRRSKLGLGLDQHLLRLHAEPRSGVAKRWRSRGGVHAQLLHLVDEALAVALRLLDWWDLLRNRRREPVRQCHAQRVHHRVRRGLRLLGERATRKAYNIDTEELNETKEHFHFGCTVRLYHTSPRRYGLLTRRWRYFLRVVRPCVVAKHRSRVPISKYSL